MTAYYRRIYKEVWDVRPPLLRVENECIISEINIKARVILLNVSREFYNTVLLQNIGKMLLNSIPNSILRQYLFLRYGKSIQTAFNHAF